MKESWKLMTFADVAKIFNGNSINAEEKRAKYTNVEGGLPYIGTKDVEIGKIDYDNGVRIPNYENFKIAKANTVLVCAEGGSAGKKVAITDRDICFGNKLFALEPKLNVNGHFLYYYTLSESFKKEFKTQLTGIIGGVSSKKFNSLSIPISSLPEQERIVKILDAAFEKIDRLKQNAEKSLQEVKNLWEATLREELKPKEGWKATTMDGVCSITSSLVDPRLPEYKNKLHVGGSNIESYTGKLSNLLTAEQEDLVSNKFYFDQTMVLYNKIRPYLVKIAMPDFDGICSADMYPLKPKNGVITREYLYYVLNSKDFTDYAIMGSARAGMPKVNRDCLFAYSFSIPSIDEQKIIVSKLFQIASICNKLQQKLELELSEYEALKQSVLRKAFSGDL